MFKRTAPPTTTATAIQAVLMIYIALCLLGGRFIRHVQQRGKQSVLYNVGRANPLVL